ncbi:MAG: YcbK family protein [Candidatus Competibacter denitrificans]
MRANVTLQPSSKQNAEQPEINRRKFLKWTIASTSSLLLAPELLNAAFLNERYLFFYNPNTSETVRRVYWTPRDGYVQESISEISWALRDHHNNQVKSFDPGVLDQLYALQLQLGLGNPVNVISGYRSPSTNGMLCESRRGVARNSYHMQAMAMDVRVPGGRNSELCRAARSLGAGGVGYYPRSNFVHIDSGPVRYWS